MTALAWRDPSPILRPRSVAIVGASPDSRWLPVFLEQIPRAGYRGPLWLVNPSYERIGDQPCYPSVRATPEVPEHLLVLVPAARVLPLVEEAAAAGVGSATIYSAGWAEKDDEGRARQAALRELVETTGFRVCGPNCLGTISIREGLITYPLSILDWLRPGGVGVVFQSGALLYPFLRGGGERGMGFSYVVSCGNEVGVEVADYVKFLAEDPATTAIAMLLEGVRTPDKFRAALALALDAGKPVAVLKVGRTERAHASTLTHTGALAGSSRVFDALFRRYGVAQCGSLDQLLESSRLLASGRRPAGRRVAMLLFSGALRSQVLDGAPDQGLEVSELAPVTVEKLGATAPLDLRIPNPLDAGWVGATNHAIYLALARHLLADDGVDLLLVQEHPPDPLRNRSAAAYRTLSAETTKPVVVLTEIAYSTTPYAEKFLAEAGVPHVQGVDRGLKAVGDLVEHAAALGRPRPGVAAPAPPRAAFGIGPGLHGLATFSEILARYRVPVVGCRRVRSLDEALAAAAALGYPVALKVESPDIAHKSDSGGVRLGLVGPEDLRGAWEAMHADVRARAPAARLDGALVQRMAAAGLEMNIGIQRDSQFGPVLVAGLGGVWVEVLQDVSLRLLPVDEAEAWAMLSELRAAPLLGAFRGAPPRDTAALVRVMVALSRFGLDLAERLVSVELNPLILHDEGRGVTAVDARLLLT